MLTFCSFLEFEYSLNFVMVLENLQSTCSCFEQVPDYQDQAMYNFWYRFFFLFNRFLQLLAFYFYWKIFSAFKTLVLLSLSLALFMPVNLRYWLEYLQLCWLLHTSGKGETFLSFSCMFFTIYCLSVYFWYVCLLCWYSFLLGLRYLIFW